MRNTKATGDYNKGGTMCTQTDKHLIRMEHSVQ